MSNQKAVQCAGLPAPGTDANGTAAMTTPSVNQPNMHGELGSSAPPAVPISTVAGRRPNNGSEHEHTAGARPDSDDSTPSDTSKKVAVPFSVTGAATESPHTSSEPAEACQQQQQQGASSAEHKSSAEVSGPSQKQAGPAGCKRFTPDQQAVAAALMVVLKRAMKGGKEGALAARQILVSNIPATHHMLNLLVYSEPFPTMQHVEQSASDELLESLALLARHCAAAQCQPLEVLTRSMQHNRQKGIPQNIHTSVKDRQERERRQELAQKLMQSLAEGPLSLSAARETVRALQMLDVQHSMASLAVTFWRLFRMLQHEMSQPGILRNLDFDHVLPGAVDVLIEHHATHLHALLLNLVPALTAALRAYQVRAVQSRQSFEHTVRLEAAAQGWSSVTHSHAGDLLDAVVAAEPALTGKSVYEESQTRPDTPSEAAEAAAGEKQLLNSALFHIARFPPDLQAILKKFLHIMDLSEPLPRYFQAEARERKDKCKKALLAGLFPGIMEEVSCAMHLEDTEMVICLAMSPANHIESFIQVWIAEAEKEGRSLSGLLRKKIKLLGLKPADVPPELQQAISFLITRLKQSPTGKVAEHRRVTGVVAAMHGLCWAGKDAQTFWVLKAYAQMHDLCIYQAQDREATRALRALLLGPLQLTLDPLKVDEQSPEQRITIMRQRLKEVVYKHAKVACYMGKSLRTHLMDLAGNWLIGTDIAQYCVTHLIDILAERVGAETSQTAESQVPVSPFREKWSMLRTEVPDTAPVMESSLLLCTFMGPAASRLLCKLFPVSGVLPYHDRSHTTYLESVALQIMQQTQVHSYIARVQKLRFGHYIEQLLERHGLDTHLLLVRRFCEATCVAAEGMRVDAAMARKMHISMCIKDVVCETSAANGNYFLLLLDKFMTICSEMDVSTQCGKAIRQALPGVLECLLRLHKWPHGLGADLEWLPEASQLIRSITEQHARDAHNRGIPQECHIRSVLAVPGLQPREADVLVGIYKDFWFAQIMEAASKCTSAQATDRTTEGAAGKEGRKGAEATEPSQQGTSADVAADVEDASSKESPSQAGQRKPVQDVQEAAEPQSSPSEAEKAEKRKAKKARQRAARAQAAAQKAEAEDTQEKRQSPEEGLGSASREEQLVEPQAAKDSSKAGQVISDPISAAPENEPAPTTPAQSSEATASSRSSSIRPQPLLQLPSGMSHGQLEPDLPRPVAPAAQLAVPTAQEEEPWQEVRKSRRKPGSQQAASRSGERKAQKPGRDFPDQKAPAVSPSRPRAVHAAAQHTVQAPLKRTMSPQAQSGHAASEQLPQWLSALSVSEPQQQYQYGSSAAFPQTSRAEIFNSSVQHELLQATAHDAPPDEPWEAPQQTLHSKYTFGTSANEQMARAALSRSEEEDQDDEDLCVVCWEQVREVIFCNCMHRCTCQSCARDIMGAGGLCPMCRAKIHSTITARF